MSKKQQITSFLLYNICEVIGLHNIALLAGILLILDSVSMLIFGSVTASNFLPAFIGVSIICYISIERYAHKRIKYITRILAAFFCITFIFSSLAIYINSSRIPPNGADAIIVLGAGLNGENVSLTLSYRLDAAIEYHNNNPESVIVVSGGQGTNEIIPEALAMKNYLVKNGIDEDSIIMEDKSSRTFENFQFSKEILDEHYSNEDYTTVYVTNGFHIWRAGMIAKKLGLNAFGLSSKSVAWLEPTNYIREYFSLIKYFVLDS